MPAIVGSQFVQSANPLAGFSQCSQVSNICDLCAISAMSRIAD
jgi:hypothetical protein